MSHLRVCLLTPALALCACSSSTGATPDMTDQDSAVADQADGASGFVPGDAGSGTQRSHDAAAGEAGAGGTGPAGTSGVNAFAAQLCSREQSCMLIDAGSTSLDACQAGYQAFYEASGANLYSSSTSPPLELYRADYVSALGSCIARASCSESLQNAEVRCNTAILAGVDGGAPVITATPEVATLCHAFQSSSCLAADSGAQDCAAGMMLYNDQALAAGAACFSGSSSCSTVNSCFVAAFTQP